MQYDIVINQGETYLQTFLWKEDDVPVDLTDYLARMQIRRTAQAEDFLLSLTDADGITLGGALGTIDVRVEAVDTSALPPVSAVYDLELESPAGDVRRLLEGTVTITREVTR